MIHLVIIGTKKPLHKRNTRQLHNSSYDPFLDDDNYYNDIETYYKNFFGNLNFINFPDMD